MPRLSTLAREVEALQENAEARAEADHIAAETFQSLLAQVSELRSAMIAVHQAGSGPGGSSPGPQPLQHVASTPQPLLSSPQQVPISSGTRPLNAGGGYGVVYTH